MRSCLIALALIFLASCHTGQTYAAIQPHQVEKVFTGCWMQKCNYRRNQIKRDLADGEDINEKIMSNGTSNAHIVAQKGLDERFAPKELDFGAGIYFSDHSSKANERSKTNRHGLGDLCDACKVIEESGDEKDHHSADSEEEREDEVAGEEDEVTEDSEGEILLDKLLKARRDDDILGSLDDVEEADVEEWPSGDDSENESEKELLEPEEAQNEHRRVRRSFITMPTGKKFNMQDPRPNKGHWNCQKSKTKLIDLRTSKRGKKEYKIIERQMSKTKVEHPNYNFKGYVISKIERVINGCLYRQYLHRKKEIAAMTRHLNERMLFHGSLHVDDMVKSGFNEQFSNIQGMFGAGLYFAKHSSKANQYTFTSAQAGGCPVHHRNDCKICERKILLCRVVMGRTKRAYKATMFGHPPPGYDSVTGMTGPGLKYPEYVVYRREQAYPNYVITYRLR